MQHKSIIQQTIHYIEQHLHEALSLESIAVYAGFSKFHFHRIFQKHIGMSATEYVRLRRLANAASALLHTKERIIDIAFYYQFESQEVFTRAFKKVYHLPPGQYRKIMAAVNQKREEIKLEKQALNGWFLSGSHPFHYKIGIDREVFHQGNASGFLKSFTVKDDDEFATMMQQFKADEYRGKRMRLSCFMKTEQVKIFSGMWMRVDSVSEDVLQFDNMYNRPIVGNTNWNHYSIVLDVPKNSAIISFGIILTGTGTVWADAFTFEEVDHHVPSTNLEFSFELLDKPTNLHFEEPLETEG